ncbi:hypothetical protein A1OE_1117 [Candidatus Endolissoclinum faulkneri L2]|uniref:Uncharacterized protein n=1 Tax=Candidatus Endolissoclinum faulkneri L2 TaxID=1193729 RepID=K7YI69_9PROT|nr:hypothetical protein A1OE_1117 [Candidatus Endolissoclinum faulkneri L2]
MANIYCYLFIMYSKSIFNVIFLISTIISIIDIRSAIV